MIKKYFLNRHKDGYPFDRKANKQFSWGYDIWLNGERIQERGFFTKQHAEDAVAALRRETKNESLGIPIHRESPTLIELFQAKLNSITEKRDRTRSKRIFTLFLSLVPDQMKVVNLKTAHFKAYHQLRQNDGVSNSTIKRELVPVTEVLNNADHYFEELENYRPPRKPKLVISKTRNTTTIKFDERTRLLKWLLSPKRENERLPHAKARRRVGLFVQLCLLTVSRPGEVAALRRTDVDWHSGLVRLKGSKTANKQHSDRLLKITPTMSEILKEMSDRSETEYLFTRSGKLSGKHYGYMREACEAVGIPYGRFKADGITFYTARHTATTVLEQSNRIDTKSIMHYTGHSDETMTLYYSHPTPETVDQAGEILEENMGKKLLSGEFLESKTESSSE